MALLALNGTGVLVGTEWVYRDFYQKSFDSPAYRTGKALSALAIAISIVAILQVGSIRHLFVSFADCDFASQLLVARNPARRSLRLVRFPSVFLVQGN